MDRTAPNAVALALVLVYAPATATKPARPREASIAFANHGGIWNFLADGEHGLFLQDRQQKWYHVSFRAPCIGLPFVQSIGYQVDATDTFDHYSAVIVGNRRCPVDTLVASDPPPKRDQPKR